MLLTVSLTGSQVALSERIRPFSTYARMRRGRAKAYAMHTKKEGADTSKYALRKVPFCIYFVIFSCARYFVVSVSCFVVIGDDFHFCFIKHLL